MYVYLYLGVLTDASCRCFSSVWSKVRRARAALGSRAEFSFERTPSTLYIAVATCLIVLSARFTRFLSSKILKK